MKGKFPISSSFLLIFVYHKGSPELWNYLLALPIIPALVGAFLLLIFFPETPKASLINGNECAAKEGNLK